MMRRALKNSLCYLSLAVLLASSVYAGGRGETPSGTVTSTNEEIDYLGVAAVMLRDGNYDRAERALSEVDPKADGVDAARYYTISGLLSLRKAAFEEAVGDFAAAKEHGQDDPVINVYLAQAYYGLADYEQAIAAVDAVPTIGRYPDLLGVKSQSQWNIGRRKAAFETIDRAIELFPSRDTFVRQRIFYFIELDLTRAAAEESRAYLENAGEDPEAYLTVGEALRRGGDTDLAVDTLEMAKLLFPENERVKIALAQAYLDRDQPFTAARIVEEAAAYNPMLYHEAAELYRRAGNSRRALFLNTLVTDQAIKTQQRFTLLLDLERYEEARALEDRLERLGRLEEDNMRYAMAYVHYKTQHFEVAVDYLNTISGTDYFRQATQLRRAIELVRNDDTRFF